MILLDTNIVSALMAPAAPESVLHWLNDQDASTSYLSTITLAEIGYGLRVLPRGRRRTRLEESFKDFIARGFQNRVLTFDVPATIWYAELMGRRKEAGRPMSVLDGQIASIARANDLALATRNIRDFENLGIRLIDPFEFRPNP